MEKYLDRYIPWTNAGGPNECKHGYARGIPCPECDRAAGLLVKRLRVTPFFRWYDLWVGVFIDTTKHAAYICPLPMMGIKAELVERYIPKAQVPHD